VQQPPDHHDQPPAGPPVVTPVPGRTEQALRKLQIRDPALLLRAAVIDQPAHDLVAEATAKARSRYTSTIPVSRAAPARVASQDTPLTPHTRQLVDNRRGARLAGWSVCGV
jgi:hypothetical protein